MLTVLEVARRVGRDPETVRRWIRSGKLPARKVGLQHFIDEADLPGAPAVADEALADHQVLTGPRWVTTPAGTVVDMRAVVLGLRADRGRG